MIDHAQIAAMSDELVKLAERKPLQKGDLKRFAKGLAVVGAGSAIGTGIGHGAGRLALRGLRNWSPEARQRLARRLPYIVGTLGAFGGLAQQQRSKQLRKVVESGRVKQAGPYWEGVKQTAKQSFKRPFESLGVRRVLKADLKDPEVLTNPDLLRAVKGARMGLLAGPTTYAAGAGGASGYAAYRNAKKRQGS